MQGLSYDNPFFERFQTRARRRLIAAVYVTVGVVLFIATGITESWLMYATLLAMLTAAGILLGGSTRGIGDSEQHLDERQNNLRASAYRFMYWTAIVVAAWAGMTVSGYMEEARWMLALAVTTFSVSVLYALPSLLLAWQLPDERADEA
jgi:hypothetical protein